MKYNPLTLLTVIVGLATAAAEEKSESIALSQVPANVVAAAHAAVPGLTIEEAERETESDGSVVYELEGKANGKEVSLEITAAGQVVELETDDD